MSEGSLPPEVSICNKQYIVYGSKLNKLLNKRIRQFQMPATRATYSRNIYTLLACCWCCGWYVNHELFLLRSTGRWISTPSSPLAAAPKAESRNCWNNSPGPDCSVEGRVLHEATGAQINGHASVWKMRRAGFS